MRTDALTAVKSNPEPAAHELPTLPLGFCCFLLPVVCPCVWVWESNSQDQVSGSKLPHSKLVGRAVQVLPHGATAGEVHARHVLSLYTATAAKSVCCATAER